MGRGREADDEDPRMSRSYNQEHVYDKGEQLQWCLVRCARLGLSKRRNAAYRDLWSVPWHGKRRSQGADSHDRLEL